MMEWRGIKMTITISTINLIYLPLDDFEQYEVVSMATFLSKKPAATNNGVQQTTKSHEHLLHAAERHVADGKNVVSKYQSPDFSRCPSVRTLIVRGSG